MTAASDTREAWLIAAARELSELFAAVGEEVPPLHLSVGFPGGTSNRKKTIGQCWSRSQSADEVNQIFISPIRGEDRTVDILGTLAHEMVHAVDDCKDGHRGNFARVAKSLGFVAKLTSSDNRTEEFTASLSDIAERIGPIPHPTLGQDGRGSEDPKKQSSRMLKVVCEDCEYTLRTTQKWIDVGLPTCCCGGEMVAA